MPSLHRLACLLVVSGFLALPSTGAERRPNIIFLLTDDQRDNTFGAMGHPFVKTPTLTFDHGFRNFHPACLRIIRKAGRAVRPPE